MSCQASPPAATADALASASAALGWLASADATRLTTSEQADALRALERLQAQLVSARSAVLAAFNASRGFEDDAAGSPVSWLRWQTRVTGAAASAAAGWMRDLAAHPAIAAALAAGDLSVSWARQLCGWTDRLPEDARGGADRILLDAAAAGARLSDLGGLAEQLYRLTAGPDTDGADDGFNDRRVRLLTHFRGAGKLDGDLTPECAASLRAVLDSMSAKTGPEDVRTPAQRQHDALAEMCYRFVAGGLPDRAGQPTQIHLHMSLDQLLGLPGAADATAVWAGHGATAPAGTECDASITPIVTAHVDSAELGQQARDFLPCDDSNDGGSASCTVCGDPGHANAGGCCRLPQRTAAMAQTAAQELLLTRALRLLSGPALQPTCAAASYRSLPPASASPSTSAGPPTPSRRTCAAPSSLATSTAPSPAATSHPQLVRYITSSRFPAAGPLASRTAACSASSITRSPFIAGAGSSASTRTAPLPRHSASASCTATPRWPLNQLVVFLYRVFA